MEDRDFLNRMKELANRSYFSSRAVFSDFLNASQQSEEIFQRLPVQVTFFGGSLETERKMARFGEGEEPFPISALLISPKGEKFAEVLTHRDYLGALLALGIDRSFFGDILVSEKSACVFAQSKMAVFLAENLEWVGKNAVCAKVVESVPPCFARSLETVQVTVTSLRLDAVLSRLYGLSRENAQTLVETSKVLLFGKPVLKAEYSPKKDDVFAVKGFGKWKIGEVVGNTKKGKLVLQVQVYQ